MNLKRDYNEVKLIKEDIIDDAYEPFDFPKYTRQIINLANQNEQSTRPNMVGQMSELIKNTPLRNYSGWKQYYLTNYPENIEKATEKAYEGVIKLQEAAKKIDKNMVRNWVYDLVINKTAEGLIFQEAIIKDLAEKENKKWRLASPEEESKGIDGYIGDKPVQIKSVTYEAKNLNEEIQSEIIYYKKTKTYLNYYIKK